MITLDPNTQYSIIDKRRRADKHEQHKFAMMWFAMEKQIENERRVLEQSKRNEEIRAFRKQNKQKGNPLYGGLSS